MTAMRADATVNVSPAKPGKADVAVSFASAFGDD
jgi:hypothetical protein